jgi:hypothetical protein
MQWAMSAVLIEAEHWREKYRLAEIAFRELPSVAAGESYSAFGYTAKFSGHVDKWVISRDSDGHPVRRGIMNRDDAVATLLREHAPAEGRTVIAR